MFWDNRKILIRTIAAAALAGSALIAASAPASAQSVVVRSTGPSAASYPQGRRLAANTTVTLRAGDQVTVLDRAGTRVLRGPGTVTLDGRVVRNQDSATRVASFVSRGTTGRARTGAVRSGATTAAAPAAPTGPSSIWQIDVTKPGNWCVVDPATTVLWRPDRTGTATGRLTADQGGAAAALDWRSGNPLKLWPADTVPLTDGASYNLQVANAPALAITTLLIGTAPAEVDELAGVLIDKGCINQLDQLLGVIESADASTPAAGG